MRKLTCPRVPRGERGASIVELALIAPVMILIVMGVVDLARGYQLQIRLENAAREGAAYAQIYPNSVSCGTEVDITDRVRSEQQGIEAIPGFRVDVFVEDANGDLTEPVTGCGGTTAEGSDRVRVDVTATYEILTPLVANVVGRRLDLTGSADMGVQQ